MLRKYVGAAIVLLSIMLWLSCSKSNEMEFNNGGNQCDTVNMKYSVNVQPILQSNCYSCHASGISTAGVTLDTYAGVKQQADNGNLVNVISHTPGYPAMPNGLPKLSDCNINIIKDWVDRGASNN
jgi:uncharacterized membrane protein